MLNLNPHEQRLMNWTGNYMALHEWVVLQDLKRQGYDPDLVSSLVERRLLKRTTTDIGICLTIGADGAGVTKYGASTVTAEGAVANAASLALLRLRLKHKEYGFVRYNWKGRQYTVGDNTALRLANPTALLMKRPEALLQWQYGYRLPRLKKDSTYAHLGVCFCYATTSNGGPSERRVKELLKKHDGMLQREAGSVIIGTPYPENFDHLVQVENASHRALLERCAREGHATAAATSAFVGLAPRLIVERLFLPS